MSLRLFDSNLFVQNKPPEEYDIEALTGNEKEYIEMVKLIFEIWWRKYGVDCTT